MTRMSVRGRVDQRDDEHLRPAAGNYVLFHVIEIVGRLWRTREPNGHQNMI